MTCWCYIENKLTWPSGRPSNIMVGEAAMATHFPKGETIAWNFQSLKLSQSLLTVVLILFINNELRQASVFWAMLHSDLSSLTYDVRVRCGKTFQVGQFRQVRSRPLKPSAGFKLWTRRRGEVFWGLTEPTGVSMLLPTPSCAHLPVWAGWQGGVTGLTVVRTRWYLDGPLATAQGQNITSSWFSLTGLRIAWGNRPQSCMLARLLFGLQHAPPAPKHLNTRRKMANIWTYMSDGFTTDYMFQQ